MEVVDKKLVFSYKDNGPGFSKGQDFSNTPGLGLSLIHAQLDQLHAEYELETNEKFELKFEFNISERGPHSNM